MINLKIKDWMVFLYKDAIWIGLAVAILLIGEVAPNERLVLFTVPLNTLIIAILLGAALLSRTTIQSFRFIGVPYILLSISLVYGLLLSQNFDYGFYKAGNLCAITLAVIVLFHNYYINGKQDDLWRLVIAIMLSYLVLAILYKLQHGFWDRQVVFLMNGPIVFARLMGMAAILTLLFTKGATRIILFSAFLLAALWPSSKGPLLSLILTFALMMLAHDRLVILSLIAIVLAVPVLLIPEQTVELVKLLDGTGRLAAPLESVILGKELAEAHNATYGSRATAYVDTFPVIMQHPQGVGMGDWPLHVKGILEYPHNFFLESFSELGIIFGFFFVIPYLWPLLRPKNKLLWVAVFFAINQQVSGDLLDSRYWLIFGILACVPVRSEGLDLFKTFLPRSRPVSSAPT